MNLAQLLFPFSLKSYMQAHGAAQLLARQEPWRVGLYVAGSLLVGWHVFHGFQSAFRSLGVNHSGWTPVFRKAGAGLGLLFALGFASLPLWIFFIR